MQPFFETLPSYMNTCAKKVEVTKANIVYRRNEMWRFKGNRNVQQLRNLRFKVLSEMVNLQMGRLIYISLHMDVRPILYGR